MIVATLRGGGYDVVASVVDAPASMRAALVRESWDVITSDHSMPHFSAPAAHALAMELCPLTPFIIVSGEIDVGLAVSLMKEGAKDFIQKRELARLVPTIQRELLEVAVRREGRETKAALEFSETRYRRLFETAQDGILILDADTGLIQDVLENLLGNAWKFTSGRAHARIAFGTVTEADGGVAYFVKDDGAGFDMASSGKLFGAFQRLHTEKEFPGTGIGLATVRRIVHRHGGWVRAEGKVGEGATFYFTVGDD